MGSIISSFRVKTDKKVYPKSVIVRNKNKTIYLVDGKVVGMKER
jgi:hypothetical protein